MSNGAWNISISVGDKKKFNLRPQSNIWHSQILIVKNLYIFNCHQSPSIEDSKSHCHFEFSLKIYFRSKADEIICIKKKRWIYKPMTTKGIQFRKPIIYRTFYIHASFNVRMATVKKNYISMYIKAETKVKKNNFVHLHSMRCSSYSASISLT